MALSGCQQVIGGAPSTDGPDISQAAFREITNGAFLGGGLLYNPANPGLNHFGRVNRIPVRVARVRAEAKVGDTRVTTVGADGNPVVDDQTGVTETKYQDVANSVWMGWLTVLSLTPTALVFDLDLFDANLDLKRRERQFTLALGQSYDFNGDGLADLEFKPFDAAGRVGFDSTFILNFVNHKPTLERLGSTAMHKVQDDPSFPLPSNIQTVNPSGNLVIRLFDDPKLPDDVVVAASSLTTLATSVPDLVKGDFVNVVAAKELGANATDQLYVIDTDVVAGTQVTLSTAPAPLTHAYEVMSLSLKGNVAELEARFLQSDSRGLARSLRGGFSWSRDVINEAGTLEFPLPKGVEGHAHLEYLFKLALHVRMQTNLGWTEVSGRLDFWIDTEAKAILDAALNVSLDQDFNSGTLLDPSFLFFAGPIPIRFGAAISVGTRVKLAAAGRLRLGGGFEGKLGLSARAGAWVEWDWLRTRIRTRAGFRGIHDFSSWKEPPIFEITGRAVVRPYLQVVPRVTVAELLSAFLTLRAYLEADGTLKASNLTGVDVTWELNAGVKGQNPGVGFGVNIFGHRIGIDHLSDGVIFDVNRNLAHGTHTFPLPSNPRVLTPSFTPPGGSYAAEQTVAIASATPYVTLHYTLDGSEPTVNSPRYAGPILVDRQTTIRARGWRTGFQDSFVNKAEYTITGPLPTPTITPAAGTWLQTERQEVTITSPTVGAILRYTTDKSEPHATSTRYYGPFWVNTTTTIKARAFLAGRPESASVSANLVFQKPLDALEAPVFKIRGGTYLTGKILLVMLSGKPGLSIRYTLDGTTPSPTHGIPYSDPIFIPNNLGTRTLRAIAYGPGFNPSVVSQETYTFIAPQGIAGAPVFHFLGGTYASGEEIIVTLTSPSAGVSIHYTLDGTTPTKFNGTLYTGPITIPSHVGARTLRAIAYGLGFIPSAVSQQTYTFIVPLGTVGNVAISTERSTVFRNERVFLGNPTAGAVIRYTLDGSIPTRFNGLTHISHQGVIIAASTTLKVRAFKDGYNPSAILSRTFVVVRGISRIQITGSPARGGPGGGNPIMFLYLYNPGTGWHDDSVGPPLATINQAFHHGIDQSFSFSPRATGEFLIVWGGGGIESAGRTLRFFDDTGVEIRALELNFFESSFGTFQHGGQGVQGAALTPGVYLFRFDGTTVTYRVSQ